MNEPADDTTETGEGVRPKLRPRGAYYYDDATGYEVFRPDADDENEDAEGAEGNTPSPPEKC